MRIASWSGIKTISPVVKLDLILFDSMLKSNSRIRTPRSHRQPGIENWCASGPDSEIYDASEKSFGQKYVVAARTPWIFPNFKPSPTMFPSLRKSRFGRITGWFCANENGSFWPLSSWWLRLPRSCPLGHGLYMMLLRKSRSINPTPTRSWGLKT